jgi:hypothetical protein
MTWQRWNVVLCSVVELMAVGLMYLMTPEPSPYLYATLVLTVFSQQDYAQMYWLIGEKRVRVFTHDVEPEEVWQRLLDAYHSIKGGTTI